MSLKEKGHSFVDSNVHIVDRVDISFEGGVNKAISVKMDDCYQTEVMDINNIKWR